MNSANVKGKFALGTVQFGLQYGINNKAGKPDPTEVSEILTYAFENGIRLLDSAEAYGDALNVIGSYIRNEPQRFEIISKFVVGSESPKDRVEKWLETLRADHLYAYLYHRFEDYLSGKCRSDLLALKAENKIHRIGVSLYGLKELETVIADPFIDLVQLPFNPFDSTEEKKRLLKQAKQNGKEIHVRSVFLQGLFFKEPSDLTGNLIRLAEPLKRFQMMVRENELNVRQACLNYALHESFIDYVVIGVETKAQLQENLASVIPRFPQIFYRSPQLISAEDAELLNPSNWKL